MIIWGTNEKEISNVSITESCGNCDQKELSLSINQRYFDLFWVPCFPLGKTSQTECSNCKNVLDEDEMSQEVKIMADKEKKKSKTPKKYFMGTFILIALFVLGSLFGSGDYKVVRDGYLEAFGDEITIGEVFEVVSAGGVKWSSVGVKKKYKDLSKSHYVVQAKWKNRKGEPVVIEFLVSKKSESFRLNGAKAGNQYLNANQVILGIASEYDKKVGSSGVKSDG
ncbi:MAG: hypothetical protein IEMM0008_0600 [bacterium]|nr:MAG: hypothetical protein IEMM0008_0600 [bacterium]